MPKSHIKLLICCKTAAIAALDDKLFLSSFLISVVEKPTSSLGRDSWFSTVLCAVAAKGFLMPEGFQFRFIDVEAFPQTQGCCCSSSSTTRVGFEEIVIGSHGGGKMEVGLLCGGGGVEVGLLRNEGQILEPQCKVITAEKILKRLDRGLSGSGRQLRVKLLPGRDDRRLSYSPLSSSFSPLSTSPDVVVAECSVGCDLEVGRAAHGLIGLANLGSE
ncbi:hypothetical protein Fot_39112 [Forsythia ovata]|uniref:Uncharacterized protein n=1 Tax=Forsythia ovata TaxID=205694 RepID=A0ABD1S3Q3_9LAMI